jgi:hypothetical protein
VRGVLGQATEAHLHEASRGRDARPWRARSPCDALVSAVAPWPCLRASSRCRSVARRCAISRLPGPRGSGLPDSRSRPRRASSLPCSRSATLLHVGFVGCVVVTVCTSRCRRRTAMCAFIPKCHCCPFLVWCISGSRSPSAFLVGARRGDDGRIHDAAALEQQALRARCALTCLEDVLGQLVLFQQVSEVQDRGLVRNRIVQPTSTTGRSPTCGLTTKVAFSEGRLQNRRVCREGAAERIYAGDR